jgi:hypothetical protein
LELCFETAGEFANDLTCNPHAFLVGSLMPAMRHGERRIAIQAEICPELRSGLETAMGFIQAWYGPERKPVQIEAKIGSRLPLRLTPERAGSFFSGGVDSLATLRSNRLNFALDHPSSIRDGILVHGFDVGGRIRGATSEQAIFERALASASAIAEEARLTLVPIYTNVRHLDDNVKFWEFEFHGAALASVAHALSHRLSSVSIASTYDIPNLKPWGSHPLLDPNYSSIDLRIRHDGLRLSRLNKVRLVADWNVALQNLRVCTANSPEKLNCGMCEKCIRTMTELLVVGKLVGSGAFAVHDVSRDLLNTIQIGNELVDSFYCDLIEPLKAVGRLDLVEVIQVKSQQFRKRLAWEQGRDWKGAAKRLDHRFLGGGVYKSYKAVRGNVLRRRL